jgi:uncharacterized iron-regulated protein
MATPSARGPARAPRSRLAWLRGAVPLLALAAACTVVLHEGSEWRSPLARDHPLVGVIWDVAAHRPIARGALVERLAASEIVFLGDKHDNADHHRLQAEMVAALAARGRRPAVALEPIAIDRRAALAAVLADPAPTAERVIAAVAREEQGWDWELYAPILDAALRARLPLVAADLDPADLRTMRNDGVAGLDPATIARLGLDRPLLGADARAVVAAEIRRDHCGHAPEKMLERMVDMQQARDAQLGRALVDAIAAGADGAVLVAGVGHVRRDLAVPPHIARWAPDARVTSVAFAEVTPGRTDAGAMLRDEFGAQVPFDYVWFTPRVDLKDPCEEFRKQLERMHSAHPTAP